MSPTAELLYLYCTLYFGFLMIWWCCTATLSPTTAYLFISEFSSWVIPLRVFHNRGVSNTISTILKLHALHFRRHLTLLFYFVSSSLMVEQGQMMCNTHSVSQLWASSYRIEAEERFSLFTPRHTASELYKSLWRTFLAIVQYALDVILAELRLEDILCLQFSTKAVLEISHIITTSDLI